MDGYDIQPATPPAATGLRHHAIAIALAVLGGLLGIIGAAFREVRADGFLLLPFVGAPIIEELLKPSGIYIVLWRWPGTLRNRLYTAALTALSGLSFALIEAAVYLTLYVPDHPRWFFIYRLTAPVLLHVSASFLVGLGLSRRLIDWAEDGGSFPKMTRNFMIAAIVLRALFNVTTFSLAIAGVLDVE